jgi:ketosteroid isomerase-like protein
MVSGPDRPAVGYRPGTIQPVPLTNVELVRRGWDAASRGDFEAVSEMLAPGVRWHGAGDATGGCQNRQETLEFMREAISRGIRVTLLEARDLGAGRVLALLQRNLPHEGDPSGQRPQPHAEILTVRDGKIAEMVVYQSAEEALGDQDLGA